MNLQLKQRIDEKLEHLPQWRLFIITGFLGGLTTFSTFSAEVTALLQSGRLMWAMGAIAAHVGLSLLMTVLGMATVWGYRQVRVLDLVLR